MSSLVIRLHGSEQLRLGRACLASHFDTEEPVVGETRKLPNLPWGHLI